MRRIPQSGEHQRVTRARGDKGALSIPGHPHSLPSAMVDEADLVLLADHSIDRTEGGTRRPRARMTSAIITSIHTSECLPERNVYLHNSGFCNTDNQHTSSTFSR